MHLALERRQPAQVKKAGLYPGMAAELTWLLVDVNRRCPVFESTEKIGLLLSIKPVLLPLPEPRREQVSVSSTPFKDLIAGRRQTHLLLDLSVKSLQGRLSLIHSSLRELPGPLDLKPLADQELVITVQKEKCHIGPVSRHWARRADDCGYGNREVRNEEIPSGKTIL